MSEDLLEINLEEIAQDIQELSKIGEKLKNSRLNERAVILLIQSETKLPKRDIKYVLDTLPQLEKLYLKKEK